MQLHLNEMHNNIKVGGGGGVVHCDICSDMHHSHKVHTAFFANN